MNNKHVCANILGVQAVFENFLGVGESIFFKSPLPKKKIYFPFLGKNFLNKATRVPDITPRVLQCVQTRFDIFEIDIVRSIMILEQTNAMRLISSKMSKF